MTLSRKVADPVWGQRRPDATQILYYYYLGGEQKNNKYTKNSLIWMLCRIALSPDFNCKPGRQLDKTLSLFW
jgi:hypothetical protein